MWLIKQDVLQSMQLALKAGIAPTAEQRAAFTAQRYTADSGGDPGNIVVAGDVAEICIEGVLTEKPDLMCMLFGGGNTAYCDIRAAFALAESDPNVKRVELAVDTPGGKIAGLFDTIATIQAFSKPIKVKAAQACSAGYVLAAAAGKIEASGPASEFGSIGVVASFCFDADDEQIDITSTEAPDKRPDPRTPEGKAKIREYLDSVHELFVGAIATGRTASGSATTADDVNADYGRGATLLAAEAKRRGMIDKITAPRASARSGSAVEIVVIPDASPQAVTGAIADALALSATGSPATPAVPPIAATATTRDDREGNNPMTEPVVPPVQAAPESSVTVSGVKLLGVATEAEAATKINEYQRSTLQILGATGKATMAEAMPVLLDWKQRAEQHSALTSQVAQLTEESRTAKRDAALERMSREGSLPPARHDWARTQFATADAVETFCAGMPKGFFSAVTEQTAAATAAITADERKICELTGVSEQVFLEQKKLDQQARSARVGA